MKTILTAFLFVFCFSFTAIGHSAEAIGGEIEEVLILPKKGNALEFSVPIQYVDNKKLISPMSVIAFDKNKQLLYKIQTSNLTVSLPEITSTCYVSIKVGNYSEIKKLTR